MCTTCIQGRPEGSAGIGTGFMCGCKLFNMGSGNLSLLQEQQAFLMGQPLLVFFLRFIFIILNYVHVYLHECTCVCASMHARGCVCVHVQVLQRSEMPDPIGVESVLTAAWPLEPVAVFSSVMQSDCLGLLSDLSSYSEVLRYLSSQHDSWTLD